jgi:hypothetical protein
MYFVPTVVAKLVFGFVPGLDTGPEMDPCNTSNSIDVASCSGGLCNTARNLGAETEELVPLEREPGVFPYFEEDVIWFDLDLAIILVMFFDGVDESVPVVFIDDPVR